MFEALPFTTYSGPVGVTYPDLKPSFLLQVVDVRSPPPAILVGGSIFCGVGIALEMLLTAEPIDAQRALQINLVSKVVPHDKLMEVAEAVAKTILRNDQASVRSAKQVTLDMIGRNLDDQLYKEAYASYTLMASNPTVPGLLKEFYEKTDKGRHGVNATSF